MKKIMSVIFFVVLAILCGYMIFEIEQVQAATPETIEEVSPYSTHIEILEDGTQITTEKYEDGTVMVTEIAADGKQTITKYFPESYGIQENVCPVEYNVKDNEWYVEMNNRESTDKPNEEPPVGTSYESNQASGCITSLDQIMQLANGTYDDMQLYTNDGAFFYLIDENDVVEITVNGTKYTLDANNPTLELQLEFGDEVIINSSNPQGVYYDTECGNMDSSEHYYEYSEE